MQRRILIDDVTYICEVTYSGDTEFWSCSRSRGEQIADFLRNNGAMVNSCEFDGMYCRIEVDRSRYTFMGESYWMLNQCDGDLVTWLHDSLEGDFTYYYDKIIFNTEDGFVAAYRDDINNNWKF
jgi:hypothetical protein